MPGHFVHQMHYALITNDSILTAMILHDDTDSTQQETFAFFHQVDKIFLSHFLKGTGRGRGQRTLCVILFSKKERQGVAQLTIHFRI